MKMMTAAVQLTLKQSKGATTAWHCTTTCCQVPHKKENEKVLILDGNILSLHRQKHNKICIYHEQYGYDVNKTGDTNSRY
jgi:hypothetical protein